MTFITCNNFLFFGTLGGQWKLNTGQMPETVGKRLAPQADTAARVGPVQYFRNQKEILQVTHS